MFRMKREKKIGLYVVRYDGRTGMSFIMKTAEANFGSERFSIDVNIDRRLR